MKIVIGLGNPGSDYAKNRHNVGFMVIDHLAGRLCIEQFKDKFKALIAEVRLGSEKVILVKPMTFMNASGEAVLEIVRFYKEDLSDVLVIYDDMDIELGRLRVRQKGSAGGHNGMKSIIYQLQNDKFPRLRVGIGKPPYDVINYVLGNFTAEEFKVVEEVVEKSADAVEEFINKGIIHTMNIYNEK